MSNYEVEILVNGRSIPVYNHNGSYFVEGRRGSPYELKFINNTWNRVEVVVSVDGLSVMRDGQSGVNDQGYLVNGRNSIIIPGFRRGLDKVAEFLFSEKKDSYSAETGQGTQNVGAIGFMVFQETTYYNPVIVMNNSINASPTFSAPSSDASRDDILRSTSRRKNISSIIGSGATMDANTMGGSISSTLGVMPQNSADTFDLGTTWGDEVTHRVQEVQFDRMDKYHPNEIITIYYDSLKNLERRGIRIHDGYHRPSGELPNPFPGYSGPSCSPPPNWRGRR